MILGAPLLLLVALPVVASVIVLFRKKGEEHTRTIVPSIELFVTEKIPHFRKKLTIPPRALIEALILLLLTTGVVRLSRLEDAERIAIIVDTSQSMGAYQEGRASHLVEAVEAIKKGFCLDCGHVSLFELSEAVTTPLTAAAFNNLDAKQTHDGIAEALSTFSIDAYDQVHIYTDQPLAAQVAHKKIFWHDLGAPLSNIALVSATLKGTIATIAVHSYAEGRFVGALALSSGEVKRIVLESQQELVETITLRHPVEQLSISLRAEPQSVALDRLSSDNTLSVVADKKNEGNKTLKLYGDTSYEALGLTAIKHYRQARQEASATTLFYKKNMPDSSSFVRGSNYIIVAPVSTSKELEVIGVRPTVSADKSSPLLANIVLPLQSFSRGVAYKRPYWMKSILGAEEGDILFIGEKNGAKIVVLGIDPFPLSPSTAPTGVVLLLNILSWFERGDAPYTKALDQRESNLLAIPEVSFVPLLEGGAQKTHWLNQHARTLTSLIGLLVALVILLDIILGRRLKA